MQRYDRTERPGESLGGLKEIPDDIEKRYNALQEEIQQIEISPAVREGESREERYQRSQRIKARRQEFDQMSRRPFARRARNSPLILGAIVGVIVLLCMFSFLGGTLAARFITFAGPSPDSVTSAFWDNMKARTYTSAYNSLSPRINGDQFLADAQQADIDYGAIASFTYQKGNPDSPTATVVQRTYQVKRNGGQTSGPTTVIVTLSLALVTSSNTWQIVDYGPNLLKPPATSLTP